MVMVKTRKTMRRKIPVFRVHVEPGASYSQLTELPEIQQIVRDEAICAIKDGIEKKKSSILLFEIAQSDYYIELGKDKWKPTLEKLIEYYVEREEYDKCAEARDLINKL
jgi:hypothetical protein